MPPSAPADLLRAKLKLKQLESRKRFALNRPRAYQLLSGPKFDLRKLPEHSAKLLAGTAITGTLLLTPTSGSGPLLRHQDSLNRLADGFATKQDTASWLKERLHGLLPHTPGRLSPENALKVSILLRSAYGINAVTEFEGHKLNHDYGYTGYEQHLKRYPGDTLFEHSEEQEAGIAPGLGGWGYFAPTKAQMTEEDYLREKYYFAVQTLYLPDWNTNTTELSRWYKYRKMIMVNPDNGKAVVGVIADAGPAHWTGKQFGASPEAMKSLDLHQGPRKGDVIIFFVDDPENKVPLGPIEYNLNQPPPTLT